MLILTEGIITKTINIGDNNKLLTILTRDQGIIYAFLNNCKKINSKTLAASEMLCYCKFVIFKNKEKYSINEVQLLKQFTNIRQDVEKLSMGCYMAQLVNELAGEVQYSEEYLRLILNSLYVLDENKKDILLIKSVVELKIAAISGYMPNLICCSKCSSTCSSSGFVFLMSGELVCKKCFNNGNYTTGTFITLGVLKAMRHIIYSNVSKIYSFTLSSEDTLILYKLTENYLLYKTDLNLSTLKYLTTIISKNKIK